MTEQEGKLNQHAAGWARLAVVMALVFTMAANAMAQPPNVPPWPPSPEAAQHTYPLNLDPLVHASFERFYNLDYDGALKGFQQVYDAHPHDPMAANYLLITLIFRELYHLDLLDTTLYAHEGFLSSRRLVQEDPQVRARIEQMEQQAVNESDEEIRANPNDKNAYFARGWARAMHAAYIGMVDHSFVSGLHQALQAKNDNQHVLDLDPLYYDAKMVVGIQQFSVASLPGALRFLVGFAGIGGSKSKGLEDLREAGEKGIITSVEARTAMCLFLRHDGRYNDAIVVAHELSTEYPHDYLFRLEEANLMKDAGKGMAAVEEYRRVIADGKRPGYFVDPRLQLAYFGLGEGLRGQNLFADAAQAYLDAAAQPACSDWMKRRAEVNAGEMLDLVHQRDRAIAEYKLAANGGEDPQQNELAQKYLATPYKGH